MLMQPEARRERIVDIVRERSRVTVEDLAHVLRISRETVRRDLTELGNRGLVRKVHGGATLPDFVSPDSRRESPFAVRVQTNLREKRAIARRAATLFSADDTILIDAGSTTILFAEELARHSGLTVVTNSAVIAQLMSRAGNNHRSFLIGGEYIEDVGETVGALAIEQLSKFRTTHAVLTVGAIDVSGIMDFDLREAEIARAMVAQARSVTVLADSSKFGKLGLFQVAALSEIDRVVTDQLPDGPLRQALEAEGVEVIEGER